MARTKVKDKLYVVQKYIKAASALDAIKKERLCPVDDVYVDGKWRDSMRDNLADAIGFKLSAVPDEEEE